MSKESGVKTGSGGGNVQTTIGLERFERELGRIRDEVLPEIDRQLAEIQKKATSAKATSSQAKKDAASAKSTSDEAKNEASKIHSWVVGIALASALVALTIIIPVGLDYFKYNDERHQELMEISRSNRDQLVESMKALNDETATNGRILECFKNMRYLALKCYPE